MKNDTTNHNDIEGGNCRNIAKVSSNGGDSAGSSKRNSKKSIQNLLFKINIRKEIAACVLYSTCSVSMVLSNKYLASSFNSDVADIKVLIVVIQAIISVACVQTCKYSFGNSGNSSKNTGKHFSYPGFKLETAKQWAPVNILFCVMLFSGMASLQYNSVPMVTIFKNMSNVVTAFGDYYFYGNNHVTNTLVIISFAITFFGAILAAWNDISITSIGLFWISINCLSTAGYVLYMKYAATYVKLSKFGMIYYNNLLCFLFLLPVAILKKQIYTFWITPDLHTIQFFFVAVFTGCMGFFLNFASLNCVATTGPTTYVVVGSFNKVPVALLGYFLFSSNINKETWFFITISLCGGFLYSYATIKKTTKATK